MARRQTEAASSLARSVGGTALLVVGAVHLEQYYVDDYSVVPTIGTLFLLNFVAATIVGLAVLVPIERLRPRGGRVLLVAAAMAGIGIAAGSLAALLISERTALFGFMESGYRAAIVLALAAEALAIVALGPFAVMTARAAAPGPSSRPDKQGAIE